VDQQVSSDWLFYEVTTELHVAKFLKKLAGRTDLEDAVKRLDSLTQEEARMALSEVLRITHSIRDEVKVVDGKVESVDEKVQVVIDGARGMFSQSLIPSDIILSDGKEARVVARDAKLIVQQIANNVDEIKCS
jgi:hypothetical protein